MTGPFWLPPVQEAGVAKSNQARKGDADYGVTALGKPGAQDADFEKKHKRGGKGTREGGRFVRQGDSGEDVRRVQRSLGQEADGKATAAFASAVIDFQRRHGLKVDGIVGRQTARALSGDVKGARKTTPGAMRGRERRLLRAERKRGGSGRGGSRKPAAGRGAMLEVQEVLDDQGNVHDQLGRFATKLSQTGKGAGETLAARIPTYDGSKLTFGKSAGGSNGARFASHQDGSKWLVKTYGGNDDRISTELVSNAIYREMGARVPRAGILKLHNGRHGLTYPLIDGKPRPYVFQGSGGAPSPEVGKHFMTDALLANWDVAGLEDDNILWDAQGLPFRVDQGGTLEFRAMGSRKDFGPVPLEVLTMLQPGGQGRRSSLVTADGLRAQAREIAETLTPGKVDAIIDAAPWHDAAMRDRVRRSLKARVAWMGLWAEGKATLPQPKLKEAAGFWLAPLQEAVLFGWTELEHPRDRLGKFRKKVGMLTPGSSKTIQLDSKTYIKQDKDGSYRVVRSGAIIRGFETAGDAARAALDRSAKGKDADSVGGTTKFKDFDDYLESRGVDPDDPGSWGGQSVTTAALGEEIGRLKALEAKLKGSGDKYQERAAADVARRRVNAERKALKAIDAIGVTDATDATDGLKTKPPEAWSAAQKSVLEHPATKPGEFFDWANNAAKVIGAVAGTQNAILVEWKGQKKVWKADVPAFEEAQKKAAKASGGSSAQPDFPQLALSDFPATFAGAGKLAGVLAEPGDTAQFDTGAEHGVVTVTRLGPEVSSSFYWSSSQLSKPDFATAGTKAGLKRAHGAEWPWGSDKFIENAKAAQVPAKKVPAAPAAPRTLDLDEQGLPKPGTRFRVGGSHFEAIGVDGIGDFTAKVLKHDTLKVGSTVNWPAPSAKQFAAATWKPIGGPGEVAAPAGAKEAAPKKVGKTVKQPVPVIAETGVMAKLKELDLQPGDKIQFTKGGWTYTYTGVSPAGPAYLQFTAPNGKVKTWTGHSKPMFVMKADGSELKLASEPAPAPGAKGKPTVATAKVGDFLLHGGGASTYMVVGVGSDQIDVKVVKDSGELGAEYPLKDSHLHHGSYTFVDAPANYKPAAPAGATVMTTKGPLTTGDQLVSSASAYDVTVGADQSVTLTHTSTGAEFKYSSIAGIENLVSDASHTTYKIVKGSGSGSAVMTPEQISAKLKPGAGKWANMSMLSDGAVFETPAGQIGVIAKGEDGYAGYVVAYDIQTGAKIEPHATNYAPHKASEDPDVKKAAAAALAKVKADATPEPPKQVHSLTSHHPSWGSGVLSGSAAEAHMEEQQPKLPGQAKSAMKSYTNGGYGQINGGLRTGDLAPSYASTVAALDQAFHDAPPLDVDVITHRGAQLSDFHGKLEPGKIIQDLGYLSTSATNPWEKDVQLHMRLKAGLKGALWVDNFSEHSGEREVVVKRAAVMHVLQVEEVGGKTHVYVDIYG